jgi:hypothetical protein
LIATAFLNFCIDDFENFHGGFVDSWRGLVPGVEYINQQLRTLLPINQKLVLLPTKISRLNQRFQECSMRFLLQFFVVQLVTASVFDRDFEDLRNHAIL